MEELPSGARRRGRGMLLAVLLGLFLGAGAFTFHYARGASYLRDDPVACRNCHVMDPFVDAWQTSSHHAVATCNDCHVSHRSPVATLGTKASSGVRHAVAFTTGAFPARIRLHSPGRDVVEANCVRCHRELVSFVRGTTESYPCVAAEACVRCHAGAGHGAEH